MAWGGPEDQAQECAAGNVNTKDWHDKVLKVIETAMASYWQVPQLADKDSESTENTTTGSDKHTDTHAQPLKSEFDTSSSNSPPQVVVPMDGP